MLQLRSRNRALVRVSVEVVDEREVTALSAQVEWFIVRAAVPGGD